MDEQKEKLKQYNEKLKTVPKKQRRQVVEMILSLPGATDSQRNDIARATPDIIDKHGIDAYKQVIEALNKIGPQYWGFEDGSLLRIRKATQTPGLEPFFKNPVIMELAEKDMDIGLGWRLLKNTYPHQDEEGNALPADLLMIGLIHDQRDAHIVGNVIDKTKYGKQFMDQCRRFY